MNRTLVSSVAVAVALSGCAAAPSQQDMEARAQAREAKAEALEDILNTPLTAEDYSGPGERCLSIRAYRTVEVLDDQHVLFKGSGDRLWLNKLQRRCIGLRPDETLRFELRNQRVCELDSFQSFDSFMNSAFPSGHCTLGQFQPVTPEQAQAIAVAFEEAKGS